jgi:PAS domain S-box-containing protein
LEGATAKGTPKHWDVSVTPLPPRPGEPLKVLVVSRDVTEKIRSELALLASETRFRAAVAAVEGNVWTNDATGRMVGVQSGWSALTGQTFDEYHGFGWASCVHPDDAQPTIDAWNAAVAAKELFDFEHRVRCGDGKWRWFSIRAMPTFDEAHDIVEWVGIHRDISERKAAEAHRELLMRELAHRSKNQLSVIQGVASQTARNAASLNDFQDVFAKRLIGISISTDLLVSGEWRGASLGDVVQRQLEPFGTENGGLSAKGPNVLLNSDEAEAIGLALHELATNCVKYGAWSVPGGIVTVSWTYEGGGDQPSPLCVQWAEHGGPPVELPTRQGFGRRIIERMVAQKLDGTVELAFETEGVRWTLSAPHAQSAALSLPATETDNQPPG